jgi:hypothetical protein
MKGMYEVYVIILDHDIYVGYIIHLVHIFPCRMNFSYIYIILKTNQQFVLK